MRGLFAMLVLSLSLGASCKKVETSSTNDIEEVGQQAGDVMASMDEQGGSSGTLGRIVDNQQEPASALAFFDRYARDLSLGLDSGSVNPSAACGASEFGSCSSNVITRTFGGCTIGSATFTGTVSLTWGGTSASCAMQAANDHITRVPDFTVTGRRSATLTVSKTGSVGQRTTWTSGSGTSKVFAFSNDGIRRKFAVGSTTYFDFTTTTTSNITVTGTSRSNRVLSGGTLRINNNLTSSYCDVSPTSVTWNATTCNCPRSGTWSGSCSDGKTFSLSITGCGTGSLTVGSDTNSVTFDRCSGT